MPWCVGSPLGHSLPLLGDQQMILLHFSLTKFLVSSPPNAPTYFYRERRNHPNYGILPLLRRPFEAPDHTLLERSMSEK